MSSAHSITAKATELGYTVEISETELVARDKRGTVRINARFNGRRFADGYTVDSMGHYTHHNTVRELIAFS